MIPGDDAPVVVTLSIAVVQTTGSITFAHPSRTVPAEIMRYTMRLETTVPGFGRLHWWFRCPATGRRALKLCLPRGARRFLSLPPYRLPYHVCPMDPARRHRHRARKILAALKQHDPDCPEPAPPRPPDVRIRTHQRLCAELHLAQGQAESAFAERNHDLAASLGWLVG